MRAWLLTALAAMTPLVGARPAAGADFDASPFLVAVPNPSCDVTVTPANAAATLPLLNDPSETVFCVRSGDYRSFGWQPLNLSGSEASPRYLRFDTADGSQTASQRTQNAVFESLRIRGSWWVVQGLKLQPQRPTTQSLVAIQGADHVVIDGNLLDGSEHQNGVEQAGVHIRGRYGDPATDNTVQRNVIRNGDQSHAALDYFGVLVASAAQAGEDNDRNHVLDNEIYDWGDAVALGGVTTDCSEPGRAHGTVVDGNDLYLTGAKRVDCTTGAPDPDGGCACAENGVDVKPDPGPDPASWTRVTNNRVWGFRPTTNAVICGGSGAQGQAISAGNACAGQVFVARNKVSNSTIGIEMGGRDWIVAGNLVHDIRSSDGSWGTYALLPVPGTHDVSIQWNTIVGADVAYDDPSDDTDVRCNAIVAALALSGWAEPRGLNHVTESNYLYASPAYNFPGPNPTFSNEHDSLNNDLCYWRRRWTSPEYVCAPFGAPTAGSPHAQAQPTCDPAIGAPFGFPTITYPKRPAAPFACGLGAECALAIALLRWRRRAKSR